MSRLTASVFALLAAFSAALSVPVLAQDSMPPAPYANEQLGDPALEAQASALMHTLRCLTCQSQTIADSDAPIAGDMRHQVRTRIAAGESPEEVRTWLMERYGDYVSYEPEVSASTWPLFLVPFGFVLLIGLVLWRRLRHGAAKEGEAA